MSNTYFQFKRFRINQDRCAMKVCTDACIQGALAAEEAARKKSRAFLDIGTGTGLLSLMLAQNGGFDRRDAIEINKEAGKQALENFTEAPLNNRVRLFQGDVRIYPFPRLYDLIICNPPFYENGLKSPSASKNQAMHSSHLNYKELLKRIFALLAPAGFCCLMAPYAFTADWVEKAGDKGLYPYRLVRLKQTEKQEAFRSILFFQKEPQTLYEQDFIIRNTNGTYAPGFIQLLKPYYLYL